MAKASGLGDRFFVGAYNLSGDTQSIKECTGNHALIDVTDITQSAHDRIGGRRDGKLAWVSYFDAAAGASHDVLSALPTADVIATYTHGNTLGNPAASMNAKQINYDGDRNAEGEFLLDVEALPNGYGLEWGQTSGIRTDTGATNGTGVDTGASADFGWAMYYHLYTFVGTDVTIKIQDSANNVDFADVASATTGALNAVGAGRVATASGSTATVRQYWRVATTTAAGFTSAIFVVNFAKHLETVVIY